MSTKVRSKYLYSSMNGAILRFWFLGTGYPGIHLEYLISLNDCFSLTSVCPLRCFVKKILFASRRPSPISVIHIFYSNICVGTAWPAMGRTTTSSTISRTTCASRPSEPWSSNRLAAHWILTYKVQSPPNVYIKDLKWIYFFGYKFKFITT